MTRTLLLLAAFALDPGAGDPAPVDLATILNEAQVVEAADTAAWAHLSFRRRTVRQELGDHDEVLKADEMVFRVTPKPGGFDEELVLHDGKTPQPQQVKKQRRLGRFAKHYRTLVRGDIEDSAEGGYSLGDLLHLSAYRYAGRETVVGVPCYRLDFSPDDSKKTSGLGGRFANAMDGSLWLTVEGGHMARAVARTLRPVSIAFSLSKVHELQVSLESAPVGGGVWLPRHIEVLTKARVLTFFISRRNLYTYSDFQAGPSH